MRSLLRMPAGAPARTPLSRATLGKAIAALCVAWTLGSALGSAQTFTSLQSFDSRDGSLPYAGLVQATEDGDLYGTTQYGGANAAGTIFAISPSGTLTRLYSFCSQGGCTDGSFLHAGLVQATNGDFYGTTESGGANAAGTIFKISPGGTLTTLYSFCSQSGCTDGEEPFFGALAQATDGSLYGTTVLGGANGAGTIFRMTPGGTLTTLYSFCSQSGCPDGESANGLVQATNGVFYGTTEGGGANFAGTIFRITPSGTLTTLHSFDYTDGAVPEAGLVQATDGNFFGTTAFGGASYGTIFKITPNGTLTMLHSFDGTDGYDPVAALVQATDGNLYGTTGGGGANGRGTIFNITPTGTLTTLYSFCSQNRCKDGDGPGAPLVQDTNGIFYGTTEAGGVKGDGTVFSLSVGLGPFVETLPTSGKVGASVKILGTDLTGAISVTFNGTPATFVIGSGNGITTTVPAGATTGPVQVVTPGGTLTSNVPFRVTQ